MSNHDKTGAFIIGCIVGGLTGAIVTLLFVPQSGEETSTVIKEKYIELRDKARSSVDEILNPTYEIGRGIRNRAAAEAAEPSGAGGGRPGPLPD
jgi:gas vesicle protein